MNISSLTTSFIWWIGHTPRFARLDTQPPRAKASGHAQRDHKRWHSGQQEPGYQGDEHAGSVTEADPRS
jgi:hypothetical protein